MTISELIEKLGELPDGTRDVYYGQDGDTSLIDEIDVDEDGDVILS